MINEKLTEFFVKFLPPFLLVCYVDVNHIIKSLFILLFFDNIIALYRFYKFRENKKWFEYKKLRKTIDKFIAYAFAVVVSWMIEYIMNVNIGLVGFVAGYIAIYEGISIFSHLSKITGLDLFHQIVQIIKEKADMKKYFEQKKNEK